jgi:hypothetical protein
MVWAFFGGLISGIMVAILHDGQRLAQHLATTFAGYTLVIAVLFAIFFNTNTI